MTDSSGLAAFRASFTIATLIVGVRAIRAATAALLAILAPVMLLITLVGTLSAFTAFPDMGVRTDLAACCALLTIVAPIMLLIARSTAGGALASGPGVPADKAFEVHNRVLLLLASSSRVVQTTVVGSLGCASEMACRTLDARSKTLF